MLSIDLRLDGDGAFNDIPADKIATASDIRVVGLAGGMQSGKPAVYIGLMLPTGGVLLGETSLALFLTVADGLKAKFGDPRE